MAKIRDINGVGAGHKAVLVYGADDGMVSEYAQAVIARDPTLSVTRLSASELKEYPARFHDAVSSRSLFGGRPCLYVADAGNEIAKPLAEYLDSKSAGALAVIAAGTLGPESALRRLCEQSPAAACLACYNDEEEGLKGLIASVLRGYGKFPDPDALDYLSRNLGADRLVTRSELDKLASYMGDERRVAGADAEAVVGDSGLASLDALVYAAFGGDAVSALVAFDRLAAEGEMNGAALARSLLSHWSKLMATAERVAGGQSAEEAMDRLRPKIIWKRAAEFKRQIRLWSRAKLLWALEFLLDLEYQAKSMSDAPEEALLGRAVMQLAKKA